MFTNCRTVQRGGGGEQREHASKPHPHATAPIQYNHCRQKVYSWRLGRQEHVSIRGSRTFKYGQEIGTGPISPNKHGG